MMRSGLYLGIDPGKRTGACWIMVNKGGISLNSYYDIPGGVEGFVQWWGAQHMQYDAQDITCIYEGFTTREGKFGIDHTPERVIGALKALASRDGVDLIERAPAGRKRQVPDEVLKSMGLHLAGERNRNAREAVRHVVAYLKSQKHPAVLAAFDA